HSSNVASAHMAETAGVDRQREFMGRLGFLSAPKIELPEVSAPLAPDPWRNVNLLTISFGHGIAVSPLQTVNA
ncbi:penicillin-binding transpeptidase domain-containing protein, partial [Salmonella enterica subsp. enterica serovar Minnesota]|uniref:penicillin-binding transpeptidase domain-containing protein n=1 Tax=Salmonella enterica TaxID=28901 RepID=UPI003D294BCE